MKAIFRNYRSEEGNNLWSLMYYQEPNWQNFTITITVAEYVAEKIKERFKNIDIEISPTVGMISVSLTLKFNNQEDEDYFKVLASSGMDL